MTRRSNGVPRRVLYLVDEISTANAGTERQLMALASGLNRERFEPHLAVLRSSPYLLESDGVPCPVHVLNVARLASPLAVSRLLGLSRLIKRLGARLVHIYLNDAAIAAPAFCRLAGARIIASRRDMGFWYTPAALRALRFSNRFVDLIAANSEAVRQNVHQRERYPLDRIAVLPNGHDPARFEEPADLELRTRLGIAPGERIVGMVANLNPWKRQSDLVRAVSYLRQVHRDLHLVLVGTGQDHHELRRLASELRQHGRVHILSGVSNAVPIVKLFDVAVLCSQSEGFSNAVLEYAFCGRPIVCTNVGGNQELIVDGETGLLVSPGDVTGLAAAIARLLTTESLARRLGDNARTVVASRYTQAAMLHAYMALYDRVLAQAHVADERLLATS